MKATAFSLMLASAACAALPAYAQSTSADSPSGSDTIVVTADAEAPPVEQEGDVAIVVTGRVEPPPRREVFQQALELSRVESGNMYEEALARVTTPLCPTVAGLKDDLAEEMVARIRANATRLKLKLGKERCEPNLIVGFAEDGRSLLERLQRKHPNMVSLLAEEERSEMLSDAAPARVWNVVETKWASGAPLPRRRGEYEMPSVRGQLNRMFLPTRKDISLTFILFEQEAALGMTVTQLADYATMRGLSHTRPASGDQAMATILGLFEDGGENIPELTSFDVGYLKSVYFWRPEYSVPAVGRLLGVRRRAEQAGEASLGP
jgi:hypothetical protein